MNNLSLRVPQVDVYRLQVDDGDGKMNQNILFMHDKQATIRSNRQVKILLAQ